MKKLDLFLDSIQRTKTRVRASVSNEITGTLAKKSRYKDNRARYLGVIRPVPHCQNDSATG